MAISGYNHTMKKKYESFKIEAWLMKIIRKFAKVDNRPIKTVIEIALRERFCGDKK